jgi:hypothetical protein
MTLECYRNCLDSRDDAQKYVFGLRESLQNWGFRAALTGQDGLTWDEEG